MADLKKSSSNQVGQIWDSCQTPPLCYQGNGLQEKNLAKFNFSGYITLLQHQYHVNNCNILQHKLFQTLPFSRD